MESKKYQKLLASNQRYQDKQAWLKYKSAFDSLTKSQFYPASSIKTLDDARTLGLSVSNAENRKGYLLQPNSEVTKLALADGTTIHSDQYIRYGTPVVVTIAATYTKLPDSSSTSSSSSKPSSSSSSSPTRASSDNTRTENSSEAYTSSSSASVDLSDTVSISGPSSN